MNSIELMVKEHEVITRMLKVMRSACYKLLKGEAVELADLYEMADFVRYYADGHHHHKEEKYLFKTMEEKLGAIGQKLIRNGMLVEHDLGRLYMSNLREALAKYESGHDESRLDIIANMISYTHLLERHINKENEVVYTFAQRQLSPETLQEIHNLSSIYEEKASKKGVQKHYEELVENMEKKYMEIVV